MKQEKDSEIIATICEYENSVAISDGERLTFRDSSGIIHLKGRGESTGTLKSYADRCNFKRNSDGVKPADCGGLSADKDFALLCWDSVNHLPAIRRISLKASLTSRLIDFKYLREAEAPAETHGVSNDTFDYEFDDDDFPVFSASEDL